MSPAGGNAEVIATKGDVILQLGKVGVGDGVRNVLVSSVVLSLASPVFATMFDGRFSEGQSLSPASPRTVPLSDDDPECHHDLQDRTHADVATSDHAHRHRLVQTCARV
jgi:hypothetical protein